MNKTITTVHKEIGYANNVDIIETALREQFGLEGISSSEVWWDSTRSFLRVMRAGEAVAILDNRLSHVVKLFNPGEYETLLQQVPKGQIGFVPYVRQTPGIPEDWHNFTIVVLGGHSCCPIMCQFAFGCSVEKIKQTGTPEDSLYNFFGIQLQVIIKQVGGDPAVFWKALEKLSAGV